MRPGEIGREDYLTPLDFSANAHLKVLRAAAPRINDILLERCGMCADTTLRLARYSDTTAKFWLNLQITFHLRTAEAKVGKKLQRKVSPAAWSRRNQPG